MNCRKLKSTTKYLLKWEYKRSKKEKFCFKKNWAIIFLKNSCPIEPCYDLNRKCLPQSHMFQQFVLSYWFWFLRLLKNLEVEPSGVRWPGTSLTLYPCSTSCPVSGFLFCGTIWKLGENSPSYMSSHMCLYSTMPSPKR